MINARKYNIGIIGLGAMGSAIALRLLDLNYKLAIFDINKLAMEAVRQGINEKTSIEYVVTASDIIITVLPDPQAVRKVYLEEGGICDVLTPGKIVLDFTTSLPQLSKKLGKNISQLQASYFDVGMLGNPPTAKKGNMTLLVGGNADNKQMVSSFLESLSSNIFYLGKVGAGHAAKLVANELFLSQVATMGEALAIIGAIGLDKNKFLDALSCTGGRGVGLADIGRTMLTDQVEVGFKLSLAAKDASLLQELAYSVNNNHDSIANTLKKLFTNAAYHFPDKDYTAVYQAIKDSTVNTAEARYHEYI